MNNQISFELAICVVSQKISNKGKSSHKFAPCLYINADINGRHYFARPMLAECVFGCVVVATKHLKMSDSSDIEEFRTTWDASGIEFGDLNINAETRERAIISTVKIGASLGIPVKSFVTAELSDSVKSMTKKLNKKADKIRESQKGGRDAYVDNAKNTAGDSAGERFDNFDTELETIESAVADLELLNA